MKLARYAGQLAAAATNTCPLPAYVILFATSRCNLACAHCCRIDPATPRDEMSVREVGTWASTLPGVQALVVTGGEPFLRDDLADVIASFVTGAGVSQVVVVTNGWHTGRIERAARALAQRCPGLHLGISISMDGPREVHDRIRGREGSFDRALATYRRLRDLEGRLAGHPLSATINITVSEQSQQTVDDLYSYLRDDVGADDVTVCLAREDRPQGGALPGVDLEQYQALARRIEADKRQGKLQGFRGFRLASLANVKDTLSRELVARTASEKRPSLRCLAGRSVAVVREDGEVFPCEHIAESMGNLRDHALDFPNLWRSAQADGVRDRIDPRACYCTHECFQTVNILFQPRGLLKLAGCWLRQA